MVKYMEKIAQIFYNENYAEEGEGIEPVEEKVNVDLKKPLEEAKKISKMPEKKK